jgi:acetolactate synthase-1/2/3 large subunit
MALGCRLSERTRKGLGEVPIIQVNLDGKVLSGKVNIQRDVKKFLTKIRKYHLKIQING